VPPNYICVIQKAARRSLMTHAIADFPRFFLATLSLSLSFFLRQATDGEVLASETSQTFALRESIVSRKSSLIIKRHVSPRTSSILHREEDPPPPSPPLGLSFFSRDRSDRGAREIFLQARALTSLTFARRTIREWRR